LSSSACGTSFPGMKWSFTLNSTNIRSIRSRFETDEKDVA